LPEDLAALYKEARNCVAASAYTGAVLLTRKLLMNIGVEQGAQKVSLLFITLIILQSKVISPRTGVDGLTIYVKKEMKQLMKLH
ncbi:hypothetical protein D5E83_24565, partial [Vibrio parahaemolyticus]